MAFPKKMVVGFINYPKLCELPDEGSSVSRSIEGGLVHLLSHALKFEYTFAMPVDRIWGNSAPGGNSTGLIGMVERGDADMALCFVSINQDRQQVVDFSDSYFSDDITFATHLPQMLPRTLIYALPFQSTTWISILLTVVFLALLLFVLSGFKHSPAKSLFELYANVLNQVVGGSGWEFAILHGCWWFFVLVVSFSYKAVIQSYLTVPLLSTPLKDYEELSDAVVRGEYHCLAPHKSSIEYALLNSGKKHLVALAEAMRKNNDFIPISEYNNNANLLDRTAIIGSRTLLHFRFGEPPLSTMHIAKDRNFGFKTAVVVNKSFCCMDALNLALKNIKEAGLYSKLLNDEEFRTWISATKVLKEVDHDHSLSLTDISGALVILISGILLSLLVLFLEMFIRHWNLRKTKNSPNAFY